METQVLTCKQLGDMILPQDIQRINDSSFYVRSQSRKGGYRVTMFQDKWTCDSPIIVFARSNANIPRRRSQNSLSFNGIYTTLFPRALGGTGLTSSEILRAELIDFKDNLFSINHPARGHLPGKYELKQSLLAC